MTKEIQNNAWSAPLDKMNVKRPSTAVAKYAVVSAKRTSPDPVQFEEGSLLSLSLSIGGLVRDDPRVVIALEEYLEGLSTGCPLSRVDFLARHPEIADSLGQCLSGLEFIHAAGAQLAGLQPASSLQTGDLVSPSTLLGEYRILREVGRGGMGVVYEAEQVSLGRRVALKVLPFAAAIDPKQRQRFQIEAQAAAQLHHPHIVPIFSVGCDHGIHYYAMQFVEGRSLGAILHELRPTSNDLRTESAKHSAIQRDRTHFRDVARLGAEAAEALDHAHGLGILHRDIKPANLLIDQDGALWITDFGLARFRGDLSLTNTGDMVGTLRYMSPEQALARRGVVDQRTDIYSLGATLYELLTLQPAFNGRDHQELLRQIALDEPASPRRIKLSVPRDLETIVLKAMAKDPSSRYTTAQELSADLKRFLDGRPILAHRPGVVEQSLRWAMRHRELVATTAAILLIALIVCTAAIWAQAHKTEIANNNQKEAVHKRHAYIIETWPLLDGFAMEQMGRATQLLEGQADPATRDEIMEPYRQALKLYKHASELPPLDVESRAIVAKAHNRLGFTHAILGLKKQGTGSESDQSWILQSEADYRRSVGLFEQLQTEFPADPKVRRYYAEALGFCGWGWYLDAMGRWDQAKPHYQHAIQLLREQIRDAGANAGSSGDSRVKEGVANMLGDLSSLASTVHALAKLLENLGQTQEALEVKRQLDEDICILAARFSEPGRREFWAEQFFFGGRQSLQHQNRLSAVLDFRLVTLLAPNFAEAHNSLAWVMVSNPESTPFSITVALDSARKAVELKPEDWTFWNTLGVAAFRAQDWELASESLEKSIELHKPGGAIDFYFLAMTRKHQGREAEAEKLFKKGETYLHHNPGDHELAAYRREADRVLHPAATKAGHKTESKSQGNAKPIPHAQS